mmetsp:Transcript_9436/g.33183  ORF Transcript_9436/g.33183 Transcript_9436/m.33183 type:complete len:203 (+) Transcript_9436:661-1269(+)
MRLSTLHRQRPRSGKAPALSCPASTDLQRGTVGWTCITLQRRQLVLEESRRTLVTRRRHVGGPADVVEGTERARVAQVCARRVREVPFLAALTQRVRVVVVPSHRAQRAARRRGVQIVRRTRQAARPYVNRPGVRYRRWCVSAQPHVLRGDRSDAIVATGPNQRHQVQRDDVVPRKRDLHAQVGAIDCQVAELNADHFLWGR